MSEQKSFETEWRRLLKISPRTADDYRRAHNRAVMDEELGALWIPVPAGWLVTSSDCPICVEWAQEVSQMKDGKATAVRSRMRE